MSIIQVRRLRLSFPADLELFTESFSYSWFLELHPWAGKKVLAWLASPSASSRGLSWIFSLP